MNPKKKIISHLSLNTSVLTTTMLIGLVLTTKDVPISYYGGLIFTDILATTVLVKQKSLKKDK